MKKYFSFFAIVFCALSLTAQVHISVDDFRTWSAQQLAPYIGQTVVFDVPMVVCSNANGKYTVAPWRRFVPDNQGFAGSDEYNETVRMNGAANIALNGVSAYHRCGEKIYNLRATVNSTSSLSWQGGEWRGNTRDELEKADLREMVGIDGCDSCLLVCGFNLENYYMTWGSMGARSYDDHQDQRAKISKALKKINADIYGLVELQQGNEAVEEITADLNKNIPGRNYKHFNDPSSGTSQAVGFVYDANKVEPIGTPAETDVELLYRKKMICFRQIANGEKFIYSINHFKSMNTGGADRRENEARAVIKLYNSYRQNPNIRDNDALVMGDLNCYAKTKPVSVFLNNGLIDLHRAFHADSSYSYMFGGLASYIDHAICSEPMYRQVMGMTAFHINSDEDDAYTYDKSSDLSMFRCSDHDPVLVGLRLDSTLSQTFKPYFNGAEMGADSLSFYYVYTSAEEPVVYFDLYSINGIPICPPTKIIYNGDIFEKHTKYYTLKDQNDNLPEELKRFLPLQPGLYVLRFYYNGTVTSHKLIVR